MTETTETTHTETRLPGPQVWGSLHAHNAPVVIDFLVEVLGFEKTVVYADGEQVAHAQLDWPEGGGIMMGSAKPDAPWSREPGSAGFYVATDRVEEVWARCTEADARVVRPLAEVDYGGQEFSVADPEGNLWSFGSYRGEPRRSS